MDDDEKVNDVSSNIDAEEHLPTAGEITAEDHHISEDVLADLNGE